MGCAIFVTTLQMVPVGRPFTGDYAGVLLSKTFPKRRLAKGTYDARADDGLTLVGCAITNAVRCVPAESKPVPTEVNTCREFFSATIAAMPYLRAGPWRPIDRCA